MISDRAPSISGFGFTIFIRTTSTPRHLLHIATSFAHPTTPSHTPAETNWFLFGHMSTSPTPTHSSMVLSTSPPSAAGRAATELINRTGTFSNLTQTCFGIHFHPSTFHHIPFTSTNVLTLSSTADLFLLRTFHVGQKALSATSPQPSILDKRSWIYTPNIIFSRLRR